MVINDINDLKSIAKEVEKELSEDSAFEKLLKVLVDYGMDEDKAAQMIADCIDEQYKLDEIAESFNNIYRDNQEVVINNGNKYVA